MKEGQTQEPVGGNVIFHNWNPDAIHYAESKMWERWDRRDADSVATFYKHYIDFITAPPPAPIKTERFKMPTYKQIIDMAIIFNDGHIDHKKLSDRVSMCQFIVDRLYENGDMLIPSSKENK